MRVDDTSINSLVTSVASLNARQAEIANAISSGVRLNHLSDDPVASGSAATLANSLRKDDAFIATAGSAGNRLQAADTALGAVVTQLTSAISTAVGAGTDGASVAATAVAVKGLQSIRESLLSLANSSYSGSYLFSGSGTAQPFAEAPNGTVTYAGDANTSSVPLVSGGSVQSSLAGSSVFLQAGASVFGALNALITSLSSGTNTNAALVGDLRTALDNVTSQRAVLDTAQNRLSGESDYITAQTTNLTAQQSTLLSSDTVSLATQLSAVTTQRSALLSTIGLIEKGSLFDYLR